MGKELVVFWFRRDLRLQDNAGLYYALKGGFNVLPLFIFDTQILFKLDDKTDRRVSFIYNQILELDKEIQSFGSSLLVLYGDPLKLFSDVIKEYKVRTVYANHDYEPYAKERDFQIMQLLLENGISFKTYKDQTIFEKDEILSGSGKPYTVFTPYSKTWLAKLNEFYISSYPTMKFLGNFFKWSGKPVISLEEMGFSSTSEIFPLKTIKQELLDKYTADRDYPAKEGTSRLGVHLRFGTISIRVLAQKARELNPTYLGELIWRDFYMQILWHFPQVEHHAFKPDYDKIRWRNNEMEFDAWCNGHTGYPIVDAGMRQLNATGFMHNRVRMIVASFLTKHLLIDWRWGEAYFAKKLLDFDLSANNGGWQWAAGTGTDASPYFRVFNPRLQTEKFDPKLDYIRKWVPEFQDPGYPKPIVDHVFARERCLMAYKEALS
ncbi:MAG: deoxyribodipyrimidine photo-lyase [Opitutaceae bacterium]|nr:deoxyribodipyrimidine photo-lyase [Cytophagales bacterium]